MNKTKKIDYSKLLTTLSVFIIIGLIIAIIVSLLNCKCKKPAEQYKLPTMPKKLPSPKEIKDMLKKKSVQVLEIPDELKAELEVSAAAKKLKRERPEWEDSPGVIEHKQDNIFETEYNWTEGAAGFSQMKNMLIICGKNREELVVAPIGFFGSIAPATSSFRIDILRNYGDYTKFGQGCQFSWMTSRLNEDNVVVEVQNDVYLAPVFKETGVDVATFTLQNGSLTLVDMQNISNFAKSGWITVDPISKCLFFCTNYDNTSLSFRARSFAIYNIEPLDSGRLRISGLSSAVIDRPISKCTGGCFSNNGILYLLNNDDDNSGFSAYTFNYNQYLPGYVFNKVRDYRVYTPDESIWSSDNQDLVGIGYFKFPNQERFLGILHRNEDVDVDNITYTKATGLM